MPGRCTMDGFPFHWKPVLLPKDYDCNSGTFTYENVSFCSPECAKGYLFKDVHTHTDRIHLFSLYCRNILGLKTAVGVCADVASIKDYMVDPESGISIEQFRESVTTMGIEEDV